MPAISETLSPSDGTRWTKERLEQVICDGVEENISLDYKAADALAKTDPKTKFELTKDVSSFANSSGGILIYGIAESTEPNKRHLPERLDPLLRTEISKEWLDQVIQTIQPRIDGITIHPVVISETDGTVCYVVEVPQSQTAHMARDHRYHKRHNFSTQAMEDYEVRDVMNRRTHPKLKASIYINTHSGIFKTEGTLLVKLENVGRVLAQHVMVELEVPLQISGWVAFDEPALIGDRDGQSFFVLRLSPPSQPCPIFPGSSLRLLRNFREVKEMRGLDDRPLRTTDAIKVRVYADEMPFIGATVEISPALAGWVALQSE